MLPQVVFGIGAATAAAAISITVPVAAPSSAPSIASNLISFSIEQDRWTDWSGEGSTNEFMFNAFNNLKEITGSPPVIRIGADSEDHTKFNPGIQYNEDVFPAVTATVPYPEATNITVGQGFYDVISHLPSGTHVIWGVNFGQFNLTSAYLETKAIVNAFKQPAVWSKGIVLDLIEIGNEADLYNGNGARNSSYDIQEYVTEWTEFATNVSAAAGITSSSHLKLMGCAFAESSHTTTGFSPASAFAHGLLNSTAGKNIAMISQHHYSGSFCSGNGGLLQNLMTKSTIRSNVSSFAADVAASNAVGLPLIFGETNSYSCHGAPNVSNTAGAALWALDYALFSPQAGISRVHFHEGIGYKYNFIQPVTLNTSILDGTPLATPVAPHIQPAYYAAIIAAEAIGNTGAAKATEISINSTIVAGYAFYESSQLKRAVLINSQAYLTGTTGNRTSTHVDLSFSGSPAPKSVTIKRLSIGYADDASGVTWGGQTYETANAIVSGKLNTTTVPVSQGVDISETEAVLLSFT